MIGKQNQRKNGDRSEPPPVTDRTSGEGKTPGSQPTNQRDVLDDTGRSFVVVKKATIIFVVAFYWLVLLVCVTGYVLRISDGAGSSDKLLEPLVYCYKNPPQWQFIVLVLAPICLALFGDDISIVLRSIKEAGPLKMGDTRFVPGAGIQPPPDERPQNGVANTK